MAMIAPAGRIGKYAAGTKNPRPANSERQPKNARFHMASEMAATPPVPQPAKRKAGKRKAALPRGLINR